MAVLFRNKTTMSMIKHFKIEKCFKRKKKKKDENVSQKSEQEDIKFAIKSLRRTRLGVKKSNACV